MPRSQRPRLQPAPAAIAALASHVSDASPILAFAHLANLSTAVSNIEFDPDGSLILTVRAKERVE